ncbi:Histone deacetylase 2, partial [Bienertia sinuspersici]
MVLAPYHVVGGSVLAAKLAKERGWAINVGGRFHHCFADKSGGFCAYADISLCIQFAFVRLNISRVMIIDVDAHQGNGHELDFAGDGSLASCQDLDIVHEVLKFLLSPEVSLIYSLLSFFKYLNSKLCNQLIVETFIVKVWSQDVIFGLSVSKEGRETSWKWLQ